MSIKTINKEIQGSEGIAKRINKGAEKMVFDILQATQYSTPISSTVRELVTNACDSQREKEIAMEILSGAKKEEDYYIKRHGEAYTDSNFDVSYYNIASLNHARNHVQITYEKRPGVGHCDRFSVTDWGVGIGNRRLEGVLELGYSTKRNTTENFGAFGLGAKVALSTGVDFYTIETVHNGKRFKCNCYNYKTDFIIPKFGKNGINPHVTFSDGSVVHYEKTDEKNYTTVSFGVKKHNRSKFYDSVEEQLIYLGNIKFKDIEYNEDGSVYEENDVNFQAKVQHNSENLILSDSYVFNRPHIVVVREKGATTGINYGHIDFRELEMETLWGAIAFKCPIRQSMRDPETGKEIVIQEGVDVTPSREKVIWNEATKAYVQQVIKNAADEASELIEAELNESDFIKWILACSNILSDSRSDSVLGRLSRIVDKTQIAPKFPGDKNIKFGGAKTVLKGLSIKTIKNEYSYKERKEVLERPVSEAWDNWSEDNVYLKSGEFNKYKDLHILENAVRNKVIIIEETLDTTLPLKIQAMQAGHAKTQAIQLWNKQSSKQQKILQLLKSSSLIKSYDDYEVPQEWIDDHKEKIKEAEEKAKFDNLSAEERREIEKRMVAYSLRFDDKRGDGYFTWDKIEPKYKDLASTSRITYYGTKADEDKFKFAAVTLLSQVPIEAEFYPDGAGWKWNDGFSPVFFYDAPPTRFLDYSSDKYPDWTDESKLGEATTPQLIRVSTKAVKYLSMNENCKHIDEYFLQINDKNEYTMDKHLIKWFTASKLDGIQDYKFLTGLKSLHPELFEKFRQCYDVRVEHYDLFKSKQIMSDYKDDIMKHLENIAEFQYYCKSVENDPNKEDLIAAKSRELFVVDIPGAVGLREELIENYEEIKEFSDTLSPLLLEIDSINLNPLDYEKDTHDLGDLEKELRIYLDAKDRLKWEK